MQAPADALPAAGGRRNRNEQPQYFHLLKCHRPLIQWRSIDELQMESKPMLAVGRTTTNQNKRMNPPHEMSAGRWRGRQLSPADNEQRKTNGWPIIETEMLNANSLDGPLLASITGVV